MAATFAGIVVVPAADELVEARHERSVPFEKVTCSQSISSLNCKIPTRRHSHPETKPHHRWHPPMKG